MTAATEIAPSCAASPTPSSRTAEKPRRSSHEPAPAGAKIGVSTPTSRSEGRSRWSWWACESSTAEARGALARSRRRRVAAQVGDAGAQQRVGQERLAAELDQHRRVTQEGDTVRRGATAIDHRAQANHRRRASGRAVDAGVSHRARHLASLLARWFVLLAVQSLVLLVLTDALDRVHRLSFGEALLVALAISILNAFLWPTLIRIALPLTIITFGLASLAMSAGVVALALWWMTGSAPDFGTDLVIAAVLALVSTLARRRCSTSTATRAACGSCAGGRGAREARTAPTSPA